MKFGIFDHLDDSGASLAQLFSDRLRLIEAYDQAGIHAYHLAEHHSTPLGYAPSPGIFLSAVAQRTRRLRFGPLVYLLPFYHPLRLIEEICMLDQMSGGRFQLGVGRGISPIEAGFYGIDAGVAQEMFQEALTVLLQGLGTGDALSFAGKHYRFDKVPLTLKPLQQPHPPLWYGISNIGTVPWAAANAVNLVTLALAPQARAITDRYRAEWKGLGRAEADMPLVGLSRHIVVADSDDKARDLARRAYPKWRQGFHHLWQVYAPEMKRSPVAALYPESFDELQAIGSGFAGSPASVCDFIGRQIETSGVNYMVTWLAFGDLALGDSLRSLELFTTKVMPAFADQAKQRMHA